MQKAKDAFKDPRTSPGARGPGAGAAMQRPDVPDPGQPSTLQKAIETSGYLAEAEECLYRLAASIIPWSPEDIKPSTGESEQPATIDGILTDMSVRSANLVGFLRTLETRISWKG
jgi:hypothetical protein